MGKDIKYRLPNRQKGQGKHPWESQSKTSKAMSIIESEDFAVALGIASGLDTFIAGIRNHDSVLLLVETQEQTVKTVVVGRFFELLLTDNEDFDTALTTYLWIIGEHNPTLAAAIARSIGGSSENWWLLKLVSRIKKEWRNAKD